MTDSNRSPDATEARRIFAAIFPIACPEALPARFQAASEHLFAHESAEALERYRALLERAHDLEALELASRLTGRNRILVAKFKLMAHLAECHPEVRPLLVASRHRPFAACWALARGALRTAVKLPKGLLALRSLGG